MSTDFKSTVFLPQTAFPMKGELPKREPEWLALWEKTGLYKKLREAAKGREKFILHDGPPYANGHLHNRHALNKILKDMVNRSRQMMGFDAHYVPGWDCHGLPIEWKIEELYRAKGQDKDQVPVLEFRRECREFAANWVNIQREEFKRLGVMGDWDRPYTTMAFGAEAKIVSELGKFLLNGGLYRGAKPVMWSVIEKTALAEAEVEYHDHTSTQVWVRFPIASHLGGCEIGFGRSDARSHSSPRKGESLSRTRSGGGGRSPAGLLIRFARQVTPPRIAFGNPPLPCQGREKKVFTPLLRAPSRRHCGSPRCWRDRYPPCRP